jgi:hypothetical protein
MSVCGAARDSVGTKPYQSTARLCRLAGIVSYSSNRRNALDRDQPLAHRASRARSCAMLVAQKFKVHRDVVLERVRERSGVDMSSIARDADIAAAITVLEDLRHRGVGREG